VALQVKPLDITSVALRFSVVINIPK